MEKEIKRTKKVREERYPFSYASPLIQCTFLVFIRSLFCQSNWHLSRYPEASDRSSRAHCQFSECHHELFCYRSRLATAYYSAVDFGDGSNLCCSASDEDFVPSVKVEKAQISLYDLNPILLRQLEDRLSGYPFQVIEGMRGVYLFIPRIIASFPPLTLASILARMLFR